MRSLRLWIREPIAARPEAQWPRALNLPLPGVFGFRVEGFGFRVEGLRVEGFGFGVEGLGFRVEGFGFRVEGLWV